MDDLIGKFGKDIKEKGVRYFRRNYWIVMILN